MIRIRKLFAIAAVMVIILTVALPQLASAYKAPLAIYEWGSGVPNYNPSAVIHTGIINTSGLVFGDFMGFSPTKPNAITYGVVVGLDDGEYIHPAGDPNTNGDALDEYWLQVSIPRVTTPAGYGEGWWDLGYPTNRVVVFPMQDHGPYLGEGLEFRIYGSNSPWGWGEVSTQAVLSEVYLDGWLPHDPTGDNNSNGWLNDDVVSVFELPGTYRYVKLIPWANSPASLYNEPEINAVAGVPDTLYTLTMQVNGCGTTTPAVGPHIYYHNQVVSIFADPCPGWEFCGWTGDVANPSSPTTTVTMSSDKTVTANFCEVFYTLTMQVDGCGTTVPSLGDHIYGSGTVVDISAVPCPDWVFASWTGDVANPNSPTTTVTMDSDKTVTANFAPPVTLTMQVNGCGTTAPSVGTHDYGVGTVVPVSADPCPGWEFVNWTGPVANPSSPTTTVTMNADKTVTAHFSAITPTLTMQVDGCGSTAPSVGSHIYTWSQVVGISADPCLGWAFDHWIGDVANSTSPTTTVTMDADKTVTARFLPPLTLTMQVNGCGVTTPSIGSHIYPPNTVVDISAIPCPGWEFVSWTGDVGNSTSPATTVYMNSDKTVIANFSVIPEPLSLQLAVILDGSSSIDTTEWAVQQVGLYDAVYNGVVPRDGSVELTVVQFASGLWSGVRTEVPPTVITGDNWDEVATTIQNIVKGNGITPMHLGIQRAVEEITGSSYFPITSKQVINISSDVGEYTLPSSEIIEAARDEAIAAGIDEISAEGIGDIRTVDIEWLRDSVVWPQPGTIAPSFIPGWVYVVESAAEFETAIGEKIQLAEATNALIVGSSVGGSVTEPGEGMFSYSAGMVVDLIATPDTGWVFGYWTGDVADPLLATTTITMNNYKVVTAYFVEGRTLDVSSDTGGTVTEPGEGLFTYEIGAVVNLTAIPDLGWEFESWTGSVANPSSATTTITMNQNQVVVANFYEIPTHVLTIDSTAGGSVTEPGEGPFVYNEGTVVNLSATPNMGWAFDGWTGDVAEPSSATTTITMNEDESVTANFREVPIYHLAVGSTIGGSVTDPGEGVFDYNEDSMVNLTAVPDTGWAFDGWIGNVADPESPATVITMNQDELVTAKFVRAYTLTISSGTGGSVTEPGEGVFTYKEGTVVDLIATPGSGQLFDYWTGDVAHPYLATTSITIDQNKAVTAHFIKSYILALSSSNGGLITEPGEGIFVYKIGTVVDLTATPDFGRLFVIWSGNVADPSSATTTITMNRDEVVVANFSGLTMRTLTMQVNGSGTIAPAVGEHDYAAGTVVNILAVPAEGYEFVSWAGDVADPSSEITTVTMDADKTVTANFTALPTHYNLVMKISGGGTISPAVGEYIHPVGAVVDISAFPNPGWGFDNWTGGVADFSSAMTTVTMDSAKTITANFSELTSGNTMVIQVSGSGTTTPPPGAHLYEPDAIASISAAPSPDWEFLGWTSNVHSPLLPDTFVTMGTDKVVTAYFIPVSPGGGGGGVPITPATPIPPLTPTVSPTSTPGPTRTPGPTAPPTQAPVTPPITPAPTVPPTPTFTTAPTQPPVPTLAPTPTETPVSEPAQVPWSLIMGTIAAVVGTGVLFSVLRKRM